MSDDGTDVLMITFNRPHYTARSLERLLETADDRTRVWVWHNGDDRQTLDVVAALRAHPRFFEFHHSEENVKLRAPTNWLWTNASGSLFGKVDDDCLVEPGWIERLRGAHEEFADLGVLCCWHFPEADFDPQLAAPKIREYGSVRLLENLWVAGSGYLMKRECVERHGVIPEGRTWFDYCSTLGLSGWHNGWPLPLVLQDHMDDPRSPNAGITTSDDLAQGAPLSAEALGVHTTDEWIAALQRDAVRVQTAPLDPRRYRGWRRLVRRVRNRLGRVVGGEFRRPI